MSTSTPELISLDSETILQVNDSRDHNTYLYLTIVKMEHFCEGTFFPPSQITISLNKEARHALIRLLGGTPETA